MHLVWNPPENYRDRPVAVLGGGVLGRRIACIWTSAGYDVRIRDPDAKQRIAGVEYVEKNVLSYAEKTGHAPGRCEVVQDVHDAVKDAWLVIEAVPEKIQLKISTFAELESVAPRDCILASNSSSYRSSEMIESVKDITKARILNMHYYMPPACMVVELMTDGHTHADLISFMVDRSKEAATIPYIARKESTGFIFNRLWAAVKREVLTILAEGVSVPEEIDSMWREMFTKNNSAPCKMMDDVGLDTVAFIESHYVKERGLSPTKTVDFLKDNYLDHGKLGTKSSSGGLYPCGSDYGTTPTNQPQTPRILVLDLGLSATTPSMQSGEILELTADGTIQRCVISKQSLPDGLAVDKSSGRMFWTCMGLPGKMDGAVYSATLDGGEIQAVVPPGAINTPKQLALDSTARKVYFADREGARIYRCGYDGSDLEIVIDNSTQTDANDVLQWCVGITVAPTLGLFYWTQKGLSKGGQGRIYCASIVTPDGSSARSRDDVQCILSGLSEPIDLEIDETSHALYWTDRGEIPLGNSLNKIQLDRSGLPKPAQSPRPYDTLARNLNEAIGLKIDEINSCIYLTDLGGSIYRCGLDGTGKERVYSNEWRAFTGIALV